MLKPSDAVCKHSFKTFKNIKAFDQRNKTD